MSRGRSALSAKGGRDQKKVLYNAKSTRDNALVLPRMAVFLLWLEHRLRGSSRCSFNYFYKDIRARLHAMERREQYSGCVNALPVGSASEGFDRSSIRARW